ncbi:unnamed protein product [Rotaria sordida]|uniref:Translation elongation factor EF1B beta/delta subunit guanine nucleotide exchange domain-containing protein n=1 Tax=Rotaria sordida TaxID=392033 RepID=A0A815DAP2_9BILA|nr:unnamed protein product [Rotaria sordida]CAF3850825.1 unnamed protein product [Rotaria sordida]
MLEHLIHVNTWFPKYEVELAERAHYHVFSEKPSNITSSVQQIKQEKVESLSKQQEQKPAASTGDDDAFDLFGSDDEEQSEEIKKRLADYAAKKAKKEQIIAKSIIVLDVKPWDDETDLETMEKSVRSIEADGLVWGQSKLVPVAYGLKKLQIGCVVEDDKIGTDFLEEKICEFKDYVQSVDVIIFNKST